MKHVRFRSLNKKLWYILMLLFFIGLPFQSRGELLSQLGKVDETALNRISGKWIVQLDGINYIHSYTMDFVCRIDGLKYYSYNRVGGRSTYPFIYTIVKSKKTGRFYFARGYYKNGNLVGSTSRIKFISKDAFYVYSDKNPDEIYFAARRYDEEAARKEKEKQRKNKGDTPDKTR